jgi:predicted nucleic-acid-binding Zn-ribbon protein
MVCKCPVCGRNTATVRTLFMHLVNIRDIRHEKWLDSYCKANKINYMKLLVNRMEDKKDANKPLTDALKRDFCEGC